MVFRLRSRGVTRLQVVFVSIAGVLGGVYVWKPVFERANLKSENSKESTESTEALKND